MNTYEPYDKGNAIRIKTTTKDYNGDLTDPSSIVITIYKYTSPTEKTAVVTAQAMTKISTGIYHYVWQSTTDSLAGTYSALIIAVTGDYTSRKHEPLFTLTDD